MQSGLYEGRVRHRRLRPVEHAFDFPLFMFYLDLSELDRLSEGGNALGRWLFSSRCPALARFRREDYLAPTDLPLDEAVRSQVEKALGRRPLGSIRVLTHLRYWGFVFNPVSFYYCFDRLGALDAVVADVTNTPWGERHTYVMDADDAAYATPKAFHVSPFMGMAQAYRWRFSAPGARLQMSAESREKESEPVFDVALRMRRRPLTRRELGKALFRYPWMTGQVVIGIYWQAFRLWWKGAVFHPHPRYAARLETSK